jgi:hypothetical protein
MTLLPRLIVYPPLLFAPYACWPSGRLPFSLEVAGCRMSCRSKGCSRASKP